MKQEQIKYSDAIALGFEDEKDEDKVFFNEHGYQFFYMTKELTKKIYLDWNVETRICEMVRTDEKRGGSVMKRMPINDLKHLTEVVDFFTDEEE